jgi:hypothetical protein
MPLTLILLGFGLVIAGVFFAVGGLTAGKEGASGTALKGVSVQGPSWLIMVAIGVGVILFGAWQFEEKQSDVKAQPVATVTQPDEDLEDDFATGPFDYGDDAALDRLYDQCERGIMVKCDKLFIESPEDSEYEWWGATCGNKTDGVGWCSPLTDDEG